MSTYQLHVRRKSHRRRRTIIAVCLIIILLLLIIFGLIIRQHILHPKTVIKQSGAITTNVTYGNKLKHYDEGDFGIDVLASWVLQPRPAGPYKSFTWTTSDSGTDGEALEIFEDVIPVNFTVNRALIVEGEIDHISMVGEASDNCADFTKGLSPTPNSTGVVAKWQNVDFLCDQEDTTRDAIGTSSTDGINTVILQTSAGVSHKFFFTYTNHTINPDYTAFYNAIQSLRMQ